MRHKCRFLTFVLTIGVVATAMAQVPQYDLRTYVVDPSASLDDTTKFGMNTLRGTYVCPVCGYSAITPAGTYLCPNPYGIPASVHPATTELEPAGWLRDRILVKGAAIREAAGDPSCNIRYRDTGVPTGADTYSTPNQFFSVLGRPFHPIRTGGAAGPGSIVFAQFAWPGVAPGTRVHFLTMPPGVKEANACAMNLTQQYIGDAPVLTAPASPPMWAMGTHYNDGNWVRRDPGDGEKRYRCYNNHNANPASAPGTGPNWQHFWQAETGGLNIHVNSHRAADGDTYYVRYISHMEDGDPLTADPDAWRLWVYSKFYGLEFDSGLQPGIQPAPARDFLRVVVASGALTLDVPVLMDPIANLVNAAITYQFDIISNAKMTPAPATGIEPADLGTVDLTAYAALSGSPALQYSGVHLRFDANDTVHNNDPVVLNGVAGAAAVPYTIQPGELGPGRIEVHWRPFGAVPAADEVWNEVATSADISIGAPPAPVHDIRIFWYTNTEWNFDIFNRPVNAALADPAGVITAPAFVDGYRPIQSRFMSSRYQVQPTGATDQHGAIETGAGVGTYPRVLVGGVDGVLPGQTSATVKFAINNTLTQADTYYVCPLCGATFDAAQDRGTGFVHVATAVWAASTYYLAGQNIDQGGVVYLCIRDHLSSATNQPGGAGNWSSYWEATPDCYLEDKGNGICPYHGDHAAAAAPFTDYWAAGPRVGLVKLQAAGKAVDTEIISPLTTPEIGQDAGGNNVLWQQAFPTLRPRLANEHVRVGADSPVVGLGTNGYPGAAQSVSVKVPKYQPASEPGQQPGNSANLERNWAYRGTAVTYEPTDALATGYTSALALTDPLRWRIGSVPTSYDDNEKWDAYYICPDCGMPTPNTWATNTAYSSANNDEVVGQDGGVYRCTSNHTSSSDTEPGVGPNWNTAWVFAAVPDTTNAANSGDVFRCHNPLCPGHTWCPVCGGIFAAGTIDCPLDGAAVVVADPVTGDNNMGYDDIAAEEYDPYDIQVSVTKRTDVVAQVNNVDVGRVAPGIDGQNPDITVASAGGTPPGRRAEPAGFSQAGEFSMRNEGNTIPDLIGVLPNASGIDDAWYRMFRADAHQNYAPTPITIGERGYGWASARSPISRSLTQVFHNSVGLLPLVADGTTPWQALTQQAGAAVGKSSDASLRVGLDGGVAAGAGQVLGRYSGPEVYYFDMNGNGVFDFNRPGVGATDSRRHVFDPDRDRALEPHVAVEGQMRISEARLPFNDYVAKDTAPTCLFLYDANGTPIRMQTVWMTDDEDLANPGPRPNSNAPMNLVYASADVLGAPDNRTYQWQPGPTALTTATTATAPLAQYGPADVYTDDSGNLRTLWTATDRGLGGLRSSVHYLDASGTGTIWTGNERAQGVRGFYDPDEANDGAAAQQPANWTFWHSGRRGHEKLMFNVDFTGGAPSVGGYLPIDNSVSTVDPQTTVDTFYDGDGLGPEPSGPTTIRRYPHGPFTAVKDVSPMLYLPPVTYDTSSGGSAMQPMIRVFFAGYARHLHNFDIYEARYNRHDLLSGNNNQGRLEFQHISSGLGEGNREGLPVLNPSEAQPGPPPGTGAVVLPGDTAGEEFTCDAERRTFHSRHLEWVTGPNFLNGPSHGVALRVGLWTHHTDWRVSYYDISWGPANPTRGEMYDANRGVYRVIPRISRHKEDGLFIDPALLQWNMWAGGPLAPQDGSVPNVRFYPGAGPNGENQYEIVDPTTYSLPAAEKRPLMMEIDPTLGMVRFSAPLFNTQNQLDPTAVFSRAFAPLNGVLTDVFVSGEYSPYLWRHTLSPGDDDGPTAILQAGAWRGNDVAGSYNYPWPLNSHTNRLMLFWRRSFGPGEAPYYGRTCYMMKQQSWTIKVNHPPIIGDLVVRYPNPTTDPFPELVGPGSPEEIVAPLPGYDDLPPGSYPSPGGNCRAEFDVDMQNGDIAIWRGVYRWVEYPGPPTTYVRSHLGPGAAIAVDYRYQYVDDAGNVQEANTTELHRIGGWSQETVIPIDTVLSEGPMRVVEETFRVPALPVPNPNMIVGRRYWVMWTSPRPVYDMRTAGDGGSDVRQSSDIYYCAITPEFPTLIRERLASSLARDKFQPTLPTP